MAETKTIRDPFLQKDVEVSTRLVDRLRGKYACGPTMSNGEPEFGWRQFKTLPIQHEAADEIERLREFASWVDTWVSNPVGSYSVYALDGLFAMTRDRLAALVTTRDGANT